MAKIAGIESHREDQVGELDHHEGEKEGRGEEGAFLLAPSSTPVRQNRR